MNSKLKTPFRYLWKNSLQQIEDYIVSLENKTEKLEQENTEWRELLGRLKEFKEWKRWKIGEDG